MMKRISYIVIVFVLMILFSSCEKDFHFKNDYTSSVPVVNCRFTANQPFKVSFTTDMHIDSNNLMAIKDAQITIYQDGVLFEQLHYEAHPYITDFGYYFSTNTAKSGHVYTLKINHPTYGYIEATDTLPMPIYTDSLIYTAAYNADSGYLQKATFYLNDPSAENNIYAYYMMDSSTRKKLYNGDSIEESGLYNMQINKIVGEKYIRYFNVPYMNDINFNGLNKKLTLQFFPSTTNRLSELTRYSFFIFIRSISRNYFEFEKSIAQYYGYDLNDFEEVPELYTNIKGGRGIFCAYAEKYIFYRVK